MNKNAWIGVDLDGTLAHYEGWDGGKIGSPIPEMACRVKALLNAGIEYRIVTARANDPEQVPIIQEWCRNHGLGEPVVTASKDYQMMELWDDRAVGVERNTGRFLSKSIFENP